MSNIKTLIEIQLKEGEKEGTEYLKNIGTALNMVSEEGLYKLIYSMDKKTIKKLKNALESVTFDKKKFCKWISCGKKEANKEANKERSKGFQVESECGIEYGYFKYLKPLTQEQEEWLDKDNYPECCYHYGHLAVDTFCSTHIYNILAIGGSATNGSCHT